LQKSKENVKKILKYFMVLNGGKMKREQNKTKKQKNKNKKNKK
jgi:hypothetical protein